MNVLFNGNNDAPELEISGSGKQLSDLGERLKTATSDFYVKGSSKRCSFYSHPLDGLAFELNDSTVDMLDVVIQDKVLKLSGNQQAFGNLGQGLLNFFEEDPTDKDHFHMDYFDGSLIERSINCSLVFMCVEGDLD